LKIFKYVFIFFIALIIPIIYLFGQQIDKRSWSNVATDITASGRNSMLYEINKIMFEGNKHFTSKELFEYIVSRPTSISTPNKILSTFYRESIINEDIPQVLVDELYKSLAQFDNEYKYFNKEVVESDIKVLTELYNRNGFHLAEITYSFKADGKGNTLIFNIKEDYRYTLSTGITYKGLDSLAPEVRKRFDTLVQIKAGDPFNEEDIENEIVAVQNLFLRSGYMHSKWDIPSVMFDTNNKTDSVVVFFSLGNRIKVGKIIFIDSTYDQQVVANSTKRKFIRFNEGEYYSKARIERSIDNLLGMGLFESVIIDTLAREYDVGDFTRDFVIKSKYRNFRDWTAEPFANKTVIDRYYNAGIKGEIFHRNLFGSAQAVKLYGRVALKDLEHTISRFTIPDLELAVGFNYSQPILWQIETTKDNTRENIRVGLSSNLEYSRELLNGLFSISKISFSGALPTRFPRSNYFRNMYVEFLIERETPVNYSSVKENALNNALTLQDSNNILSSLILYSKIDKYLNEPQAHWFTSNLFSVSITGDSRDNMFLPTTGRMTNISIDGFNPIFFLDFWSGSARYLRLQAMHTHFWKLSKLSVLGIKGKAGHTFVFNEESSFVPQDRQFFAGGANSVRAWRARDLRYSIYADTLPQGTITDFSKNYIGSKTLIDGSIELRRKLNDISGLSDDLSFLFDGLGFALFVDFGNTFGWYSEEDENKTKINLSDYITKLAVGTGIGIRYETPIGAIRLDFATPLYDPLGKRKAFSDLVLVFGIGHAF